MSLLFIFSDAVNRQESTQTSFKRWLCNTKACEAPEPRGSICVCENQIISQEQALALIGCYRQTKLGLGEAGRLGGVYVKMEVME